MSELPAAPAPAACAAHPDRPAAAVCNRCGRYVCFECGGTSGTCPQCQSLQLGRLPDGGGRARWAGHLLLANVVAAALTVVSSLVGNRTAPGAVLTMIAGLLTFFAYAVAVVLYSRWLHLAVRTTNALGIDVGATPGWAVGWFFVPIASLYRPYQVVKAMARSLGGGAAAAPVGAWWGFWIASNVASQADARLALAEEAITPAAAGIAIVAALLTIVAALLCRRVLRQIQEELDARRAAAASRARGG
jgi:hypothetical protein